MKKFAFAAVLLAVASAGALGQTPRQEKLLNGLKVLMFPDPAANRVEVTLRVHSGSAFDPQGKEGVMTLLSEIIFPNEAARSFFREDLGGDLEITSNFDYIQIKALSRPDQMLALLETLSTAVSNPSIDKETLDPVRDAVSKEVAASMKDAAFLADRAVAERLFGTFPYGRYESGTPGSLSNIDFADIKLAYDRFFGADNATLAMRGNFDQTTAVRAMRRYFGVWNKLDRKVPATFRQPDAPAPALKMIPSPEEGRSEIRFAVRGFARSDADLPAGMILAKIYQDRLRAKAPADKRDSVFVTHQANLLPGTLVFAIKNIRSDSAPVEGGKFEAGEMLMQVLNEKISDAEFSTAKSAVRSAHSASDVVTQWLDLDTYRIASIKSDQTAFANVTLADVQRVAEKIKTAPVATVLAVKPAAAEKK